MFNIPRNGLCVIIIGNHQSKTNKNNKIMYKDIFNCMKRKIPREKIVIEVIKSVIEKRGAVQSQDDLGFLVLKKLRESDSDFVISPQRVKKIVLKIPNIEIKAKTKRVPKMKTLEECPACNKKVKKIFGRNLLNKKIHIGYVCERCGYTTDLEAFMPMKYLFVLKK